MNMKLEVLFIPVSDVDRAKRFYERLGFRLDIDVANEDFRAIQFGSRFTFSVPRPLLVQCTHVSIADEEGWHGSQSKDAWRYTFSSSMVVLAYEIECIWAFELVTLLKLRKVK
jgi:catechol 2,3-dioxygenase-like lactoylglutathione lyase family enzyme